MRILVAGSSGFLGTAWSRAMGELGHQVVRLVRRAPAGPDEVRWDPARGDLDESAVSSADLVVNLAGAPLGHVPFNDAYRRTFVSSRVDTTRLLAEAVARAPRKPAFLAQSGIAGYGDHGTHVIDESTPIDAEGFMADVVRQWEAATLPAADAGARVVVMRTSVVLDRSGSALRAMMLPFRLGLGARIGDGRQYFATVSLHDWLGAARFLALNDDCAGAFNVTGPDASTNAEFTAAFARALGRPAPLRVPAAAVRLGGRLAGPIAGELLASQRVEPCRLQEAGYAFAHNDIHDRIAAALHLSARGVRRDARS